MYTWPSSFFWCRTSQGFSWQNGRKCRTSTCIIVFLHANLTTCIQQLLRFGACAPQHNVYITAYYNSASSSWSWTAASNSAWALSRCLHSPEPNCSKSASDNEEREKSTAPLWDFLGPFYFSTLKGLFTNATAENNSALDNRIFSSIVVGEGMVSWRRESPIRCRDLRRLGSCVVVLVSTISSDCAFNAFNQ